MARPRQLNRLEFWILAFVVISFSYELPLVYITGMYKANPYLFDIAAAVLFFYWLVIGRSKGWRLTFKNPLVAPWVAVIATFFWATLVSATWVPFDKYIFSVFYFLQHVEGLLVMWILVSAPLDERSKRGLMWVALIGGAWVSFYAVLQIFGIAGTARVIPKGWEITLEGTGIFSTLGPTYFHAGFFSVVTTLVGFSLFQVSRGARRILAGALAAFCTIPAVVSGTRAAFLALVIALVVLALQREYRRYITTWLAGALVAALINFFYADSVTQRRSTEIGGTRVDVRETALERAIEPLGQIVGEVKEHPIMPIAGGGFYVVPMGTRWRIGYGIHNHFLFPFEQAGIPGLVASLWLWWRLGFSLWRRRTGASTSVVDDRFRQAMFGYFVALMATAWAGQTFWLAGSTEHLNSYLIFMLGLSLTETGSGEATSASAPRRDDGFGVPVPFLAESSEPTGAT